MEQKNTKNADGHICLPLDWGVDFNLLTDEELARLIRGIYGHYTDPAFRHPDGFEGLALDLAIDRINDITIDSEIPVID